MAMTVSGNGKQRADINVTPMIDVLLVLLIIFMVLAPANPVGLRALVPEPAPPGAEEKARPADVVISVDQNGAIEINQQAVALKDLPARLKGIFENRGDIVVFLRGAKNLQYGDVARVIDIARGAGLDRIALMTG